MQYEASPSPCIRFLSLLVMCCQKLNTSTTNICNMHKYACNVMECSWKPNKKIIKLMREIERERKREIEREEERKSKSESEKERKKKMTLHIVRKRCCTVKKPRQSNGGTILTVECLNFSMSFIWFSMHHRCIIIVLIIYLTILFVRVFRVVMHKTCKFRKWFSLIKCKTTENMKKAKHLNGNNIWWKQCHHSDWLAFHFFLLCSFFNNKKKVLLMVKF